MLSAVPLVAAVVMRLPAPEVGRILLKGLAHLLQRTVQGDDVGPPLSHDAMAQLRNVLANGCRAHTGDLHSIRMSVVLSLSITWVTTFQQGSARGASSALWT